MISAKLFSPSKVILSAFLGVLVFSSFGAARASAQGLKPQFFLNPEARISKIGGGTSVASGLNTGWVIADKLILGAAGFNTNYGVEPTVTTASGDMKADFSYRGGLVGWQFGKAGPLKASITTLFGRGQLRGAYDERPVLADRFWVFEPMANMNLRVNSFATLNVGAGYRFVSGGRFNGVTSSDLNSPTARIGVTLGGF